jgi:hypothetical protein
MAKIAARCALRTRSLTRLLDIDQLLARHRYTFGDARMDGDDDAAAKAAAEKAAADKAAADKAAADAAAAAAKAAAENNGFPPNTPLEQMTADQREAYWKFQSRKHEERVKAYGGLTPEQIKDLQEKATKHDALERELMSEKDKAVAEAADKAKADVLAAFTPQLVRAEFKAALTGRVDPDKLEERLTTILEPLDITKFLNAAGAVDTDKVTAFVDNIAPVTGTSTTRRGPSATGHGSGTGNGGGSGSALSGREMYEQRHKKSTTNA